MDHDNDTRSHDDLNARAAPLYAQALKQLEQEEQATYNQRTSALPVPTLLLIALVSLLLGLGLYALGCWW